LVPVLLAFYIQDVLKFKKNNSGAKRLNIEEKVWHPAAACEVVRIDACGMRDGRSWRVTNIQRTFLNSKVQQDSYRCVLGPVIYVSISSMLATLRWNILRKALKSCGISRPLD
jgi:hypothetical protein